VSNSTAPGSRGGSSQNFLGDILSARGVLTNPELQLVVQALDQKGNSDLLSAPRVTTINGVNAIIQVVNEIIYPTEFDVTENDIQVQGGGGTADDPSQPVFVPPTVIPGGFETREVGVILNVTPTVNPDNYTINLVMLPEIAELVDWIQYGTQVPVGDQIYTVNMPQPVFASRNITTSMIVWDGHTVVMGGLIREDLVTFKDKVPLLGDIPLIGRLFRSEGRKSEKRNLLIFVTARLVDPAGNSQNAETRNQARPNTGLTSSGGTVTTP
jgi:general secretion pathway protein D